jgi:hypothetical protein
MMMALQEMALPLDVMALEHITATLHLDSRCGEDAFLADVAFRNMLARCYGV